MRATCRCAALCLALAAGLVFAGERFYVTRAATVLIDQGIALPAPADPAAEGFQSVPKPGVRYEPNVASATAVPWIDSNGWRFQRGLQKAFYEQLPAGSAVLAAAEAFIYNVQAVLNPDPADVAALSAMLRFLKEQELPAMPVMANIGVVDDGSALTGEILNLFTRRNLLYRVVQAPDPHLDLNVRIGSPDFPKESAQNPYEFAGRVRSKLGDDKRLVRIYGSSTVIAHLTGDGQRARLFLLSYGRSRFPQSLRIRVLGRYQPVKFASLGTAGSQLTDIEYTNGATEFSVPLFNTCALIDLDRARH